MKDETKLTSVKLLKSLYEQFKLNTINTRMTLQKLTNRSIKLYLSDDEFKDTIETYDELTISGSDNL